MNRELKDLVFTTLTATLPGSDTYGRYAMSQHQRAILAAESWMLCEFLEFVHHFDDLYLGRQKVSRASRKRLLAVCEFLDYANLIVAKAYLLTAGKDRPNLDSMSRLLVLTHAQLLWKLSDVDRGKYAYIAASIAPTDDISDEFKTCFDYWCNRPNKSPVTPQLITAAYRALRATGADQATLAQSVKQLNLSES